MNVFIRFNKNFSFPKVSISVIFCKLRLAL